MGCEGEAAASEQPELLHACNSTGTEETGKLAGLGGKDWSGVRSQFMSCFLFLKRDQEIQDRSFSGLLTRH